MANPWGNPETESFRKKYIRESRPAGTVAMVHQEIVAVTARMVEALSDLHVEIPEQIVSYDPAGTGAQRLGLALHLRITPSDEIAAVVSRWGFDGFLVDESDLVELRFVKTPEDAKTLTDEALAMKLDVLESEPVSGPSPIKWPGVRDLENGDTGQDVQFLRLLLGAGRDEPVDEALREVVRRFQARRGAPVTGQIDADFWRRILPAKRPQVGQGDAGFIVRVLQAALCAYEGSEHRVSGTWGVLTTRDVRALQDEYGFRVGSFVRAPEWAVLLGPEIPRIEEARKVAAGVGVPEPDVREPETPPVVVDLAPQVRFAFAPIGTPPEDMQEIIDRARDVFAAAGVELVEWAQDHERGVAAASEAAAEILTHQLTPVEADLARAGEIHSYSIAPGTAVVRGEELPPEGSQGVVAVEAPPVEPAVPEEEPDRLESPGAPAPVEPPPAPPVSKPARKTAGAKPRATPARSHAKSPS